MFKNLKRVFADHLFISEKVLEQMEGDDWIADRANEFVRFIRHDIENGDYDYGLFSGFKPFTLTSPVYVNTHLDGSVTQVQFSIFREKCKETIVATLMFADEDESPSDEMIANRHKPTLKDRIAKIFKKEAA